MVTFKTFASSQSCFNCEYKNKDIKNPTICEWNCFFCGTDYEREYKAAMVFNASDLRDSLLVSVRTLEPSCFK
ncbi:zinc ribbon domain-containing protein [Bacillus cereus]|uniref:zinc ribbon domain-containing protein n=1 Tax=Bacillus cereus TaxID=1396 RepID=UPI003A8055A8